MSFPVNLILLPREFHLFGTERFNIGFEPQIVVTAAVVPHTGSFDATHPDPWHLQPGLSIAVDLLHWKISDAIDWHILQAGGLLQGDFPLGAGPSPAFGWGGQGGTGFEFALPHPGAPDESWTIGFNLTGQLLATSGGPTSFTGFGTVFLTRHIRHHTPESHTTATPVPSAGSPPRPAPPPTPQPPQSEQTPEVPAPVAVPPGSDALLENASPWLARAVGSDSLEGFPTGVAQPTPALAFQAGVLAHTIVELLGRFPGSTIRVIGHTDTVGTRAANAALGLDRALAVKAELVRLGVPAELITVDSAGEGPPQATPTRDGVPMASNRRVRVVFEPRTGLWH
jgi:outer membrane protein OmpA-like peptidoglycan-associated protein